MNQNELHEHYLHRLPEWAPGKEGVPVEVAWSTDSIAGIFYGWREGCSVIPNPAHGPERWGKARVVRAFTEDRSKWPEAPVEEQE